MHRSVIVLLSTYNGERFLYPQLYSLTQQKGVQLRVVIRDDESTDGTVSILRDYQNNNSSFIWYSGRNIGPAKSFWDLICRAPDSEYYAFCDQDDVWMDDKLFVAVECLKQYDDGPALYCSAYQMTDKDLNPIKTSTITPNIDIYHAILENSATGCTMVFNKKLMQIIKSYVPDYYFMHDEWVYKVCVAIGGKVIYDSQSHILYRQHGNNVIGGLDEPWLKRLRSHISKLFLPSSHHRYKTVLEIYRGFRDFIPENNRIIFQKILMSNKFPYNWILAFNQNFYRKTTIKQAIKIFFLFIMKKF